VTRKNRKSRKRGRRRAGSHLRSRRAGRRSWLKARNVAIGIAALLLVVGVGAILLGQGRDGDSDQTMEVDLDKGKGVADAPVTVMEYGDFQ